MTLKTFLNVLSNRMAYKVSNKKEKSIKQILSLMLFNRKGNLNYNPLRYYLSIYYN